MPMKGVSPGFRRQRVWKLLITSSEELTSSEIGERLKDIYGELAPGVLRRDLAELKKQKNVVSRRPGSSPSLIVYKAI